MNALSRSSIDDAAQTQVIWFCEIYLRFAALCCDMLIVSCQWYVVHAMMRSYSLEESCPDKGTHIMPGP